MKQRAGRGGMWPALVNAFWLSMGNAGSPAFVAVLTVESAPSTAPFRVDVWNCSWQYRTVLKIQQDFKCWLSLACRRRRSESVVRWRLRR